ncbi:MAG: MerR family transcriptional regulator [Rhodanobacteraceae bacterium]
MSYTIGILAKTAGINVETIRYYQRRGLMPEPPRAYGSIRRYDNTDLDRLRFVKRAQKVGFTLAEVAALLTLRDRVCCSVTRILAVTKLEKIDARIDELQQLRAELAEWVADCDANASAVSCPVIEHLDAGTGAGVIDAS